MSRHFPFEGFCPSTRQCRQKRWTKGANFLLGIVSIPIGDGSIVLVSHFIHSAGHTPDQAEAMVFIAGDRMIALVLCNGGHDVRRRPHPAL